MTESEILKEKEYLSYERTKLEKEKLEFEQKKLQRITVAVSVVAVVISALQFGVAYFQSMLSRAQTVEKFIPYLQNNETRDAALLAMSEVIDQEFVTQLAQRLKATSVLENFQSRGTDGEKSHALTALTIIENERQALVEKIFHANKMIRIEATTEAIRQWSNDTNMATLLLDYASKNITNLNGVVNTLVVLRELPVNILRANLVELKPFLDKAKNNGPHTEKYVEEVNKKITYLSNKNSI